MKLYDSCRCIPVSLFRKGEPLRLFFLYSCMSLLVS